MCMGLFSTNSFVKKAPVRAPPNYNPDASCNIFGTKAKMATGFPATTFLKLCKHSPYYENFLRNHAYPIHPKIIGPLLEIIKKDDFPGSAPDLCGTNYVDI